MTNTKKAVGLSRSLVSERGMTYHCVCSFDSFLRVGRICLAAEPGRISCSLVHGSGRVCLGLVEVD